jgi:hypothetical protein
MGKLVTAGLALLAALAFFVVGSPSANAFGSEVLGCSVDGFMWTANSCDDAPQAEYHTLHQISFTPHNLSGSYTTSWTVTSQAGTTITATCNSAYSNAPCISGGCTASALSCSVNVWTGVNDKTFTAALRLTQSGQTRTVTATATIYASFSGGPCPKC